MLVEFTVVPLGVGSNLAEPLAEAHKIIEDSGIQYELTPTGTCLEGDWDEVMTVIRQCHSRLLGRSVHVITTIRIEDEIGACNKLRNHHLSGEEQ
ncbi:MAG TPA: MTH1187 family thiamine-binding protein [Blastocatellia bacterium]|nr:MTH1187 family thiamine-binding protein [Blastocatellia bacterium]HMV87882.1 MTH1187 family thiamine-binding protein [Blastocatellia bacterium]HMX29154.1 MTH1187 family thiamine-binding protein [Blastocatellia bacterium]HMY72807.1 MTH1187 family thiamine-binding protein [Blastocatellia bacterium]HMZ20177.1 MTH1187 family thiamine-binding protein [Blastocatellia bacterium]